MQTTGKGHKTKKVPVHGPMPSDPRQAAIEAEVRRRSNVYLAMTPAQREGSARKKNGEIFTPWKIINDMVESFGPVWGETRTVLDTCAGLGNMPAVCVERFMEGLRYRFPDEIERYRHIMEECIYMAELNPANAAFIEALFNPAGDLHLNLYVGDALKIPEDYWGMPWVLRKLRYPDNTLGEMPVVIGLPDELAKLGLVPTNPPTDGQADAVKS